MATIKNLVIDQGTTFSHTITVTESGAAKDLSTYTATAQLRRSYQATSKVDFDVANGGVNGIITISLTAANSSSLLKAGRYVYDVIIDDGSEVLRVQEGIAVVTPEVTK
tara:strand:+ start:414 stop:740 length:327 start_codon:yes stop_codon:yes gene_type:complete